jgi:hypothetical protein
MLPAAAVGTAALSIMSAFALAQGAASKPKGEAPSAAVHTAPKASAPPVSGDDSIVGTCNQHTVTWKQLIAKIRQDSPNILEQSVPAVVANKAKEAFFGTPPKESFTITKAEAFDDLRVHPNQLISQQLEIMLTQFAVDDQATKENVQPTPKEVDDKVAALLKGLRDSNRIPKGQTDAQFLAANHTSLEKVKVSYRPNCQILNLIHKSIVTKLGHPIGPDDMLQASHILIKPSDLKTDATDAEKKKADAAALARIKEIEAEIKSGKVTFVDDAKANSEDERTKLRGGDVGIFIRGTSPYGKEFEAAAFSAKVNQVTDPVKSDQGYHLILVTKIGKDIPPAERTTFIDGYESQQISTYLQHLVEQDKVDNKLAHLVPPPVGGGPFGGGPGGRPRPQ